MRHTTQPVMSLENVEMVSQSFAAYLLSSGFTNKVLRHLVS